MHTMVVGISESGKSWAAKHLAQILASQGSPIIVFDPKYSGSSVTKEEWKADFITNDKHEFLKYFWTHTDSVCFIDEAWMFEDKRDRAITTLGRGLGHSVVLIAQSAVQMDRTLRKQCTACLSFIQGKTDCKIMRDDFTTDLLMDAVSFKTGDFVMSFPPEQHFAKSSTYTTEGLNELKNLAEFIIDRKPTADEYMVDLHGCYVKENWDYLKGKELIY